MASIETPGLEEDSPTIPLYDPNYDYYSIDNILEEDVLLKVKPLSTIMDAYCLRESDLDGKIPTNVELELPAWIAIPLVRNHCVELLEPKSFRQQFLSQLWAEPTVMNVRYRCPSFYEIGSRYAQLSSQPSLLILLLRTFLVRSQSIIRTARSMFDSDNTVMLNKLTDSEQVLFRQIVEDVTAENGWWQRKCQEMEYSSVEFSSKKCRLS
ncbi:hypothetical protein WA588_001310 [Blastocystis sp. NMH]